MTFSRQRQIMIAYVEVIDLILKSSGYGRKINSVIQGLSVGRIHTLCVFLRLV